MLKQLEQQKQIDHLRFNARTEKSQDRPAACSCIMARWRVASSMSRQDHDHTTCHELQSYGRRKGRKLSPRQNQLIEKLLPRLRLDLTASTPPLPAGLFDHETISPSDLQQLWLEIGFGGGEHLIWQARQNANVGLIGCEPFLDGVVKVLDAINEFQLHNLRLHDDDARDLLRWLPPLSIDRAFILFPDPWPKKKQQKRRLINAATLDLLARVMKPRSELRIGTDIADYARVILLAIGAHRDFEWPVTSPDDWRLRHDDWPETRYEQKAKREGRSCCYFSFRRL